MTFAVWIILILILLIIGSVLTEAWRMSQKLQQSEHMQAENSAEQESSLHSGIISPNGTTRFSQLTTRLSEQVSYKIQEFRENRGDSEQPELAAQFRLWAADAFDEDPKIRHWLGSLSEEQLDAYSAYLTNFCQDMGFELSWLLDGRMAQEPKLSGALEKIILCYSQASYQAVSTQKDVVTFNLLHDYLQDPVSRKNLGISQRVFGRLIEKGLTPVNISEHLTLSKREQAEQISQVIRATAAEYPETFKSIVTEAMHEPTPLGHGMEKTVMNNIDSSNIDISQAQRTVPVSA